jgi:hypothetical protein
MDVNARHPPHHAELIPGDDLSAQLFLQQARFGR